MVTLFFSSVALEEVSALGLGSVDSAAEAGSADFDGSSFAASSLPVALSSGKASSPRSWMILRAALR